MFYDTGPRGLYYKNITIVNDTSRVVSLMPQLGASLAIIILMTLQVAFMLLESPIMLLENIYSTGVTHDALHIFIVQATGF
jgi:hypothetical protein